MSYIALYRKYRPNNFNDVYGQEEIVTIIKNAILNNKISHAYLFCGPRGTGKTTIAKIIARLVNCDNLNSDGSACGKCQNCLSLNNNDIVEIDAASNNGVDEIRELRDKINLVPANSKYKVYIIDEVHMLTIQAFNALLKTLEEPPSHVIFILATTEPHKIPLTISSRCQKFKFSKINNNKIVDRLKEIAQNEKIDIDDDSLFEIARLSDGGMRDAINLLDQLIAFGNSKIVLEDVYKINGSISYNDMNLLLNNISNNDKVSIINFVDLLDKNGKEVNKLVDEIIIYLKDIILYKNSNYLSDIEIKNKCIKEIFELLDDSKLYKLIEDLTDAQNRIKTSSHGLIILLTTLLKFSDEISNDFDNKKENKNISQNEKNISQEIKQEKTTKVSNPKEEKKEVKSNIDVDNRINNTLALASKKVLNDIKDNWNLIEDYLLDSEFSVVSGLLKDSKVVVASDKYIIISNNLESAVDRINQNIEIVEKLLGKISKYKVNTVAITEDRWNKEKKKYIENVKNGITYELKELNEIKETEKSKTTSQVNELIDLVGDSIIEYK